MIIFDDIDISSSNIESLTSIAPYMSINNMASNNNTLPKSVTLTKSTKEYNLLLVR